MGRLEQIEKDCLRRLAYVESQVDRAIRLGGPWSAQMTVMEADIMPMGRATQVMSALAALPERRRWVVLAMLAGAVLVITLIVALAVAGPPPLTGELP